MVDPFEWLRDKDDPEVIAHLEVENAYAEAMTSHLEPLRARTTCGIYAYRGAWRNVMFATPTPAAEEPIHPIRSNHQIGAPLSANGPRPSSTTPAAGTSHDQDAHR